MKTLLLVLLSLSLLLKGEEKPITTTPEKAPDSLALAFRELQLSVERADAQLAKAQIAVSEAKENRQKVYSTAQSDMLKMLKAAKCEGCQVTEFEQDGKKVVGLLRPPPVTAKK